MQAHEAFDLALRERGLGPYAEETTKLLSRLIEGNLTVTELPTLTTAIANLTAKAEEEQERP